MQTLSSFLLIIFTFWPLILIFGILDEGSRSRSWKDKVHIALRRIFIAWCVMAIIAVGIYLGGNRPVGFIPEPYNLISFVLFGLAVGIPFLIHEGILLRARKDRQANIAELESLRKLSPSEFEQVIADFFQSMGYRTRLSEAGHDHGVDVMVYDGKGQKWVVQCKRYRGVVGEPILRDLLGAMLHERAQRAYLMTTGRISKNGREWVKGKPIIIYAGQGLVRLLNRVDQA